MDTEGMLEVCHWGLTDSFPSTQIPRHQTCHPVRCVCILLYANINLHLYTVLWKLENMTRHNRNQCSILVYYIIIIYRVRISTISTYTCYIVYTCIYIVHHGYIYIYIYIAKLHNLGGKYLKMVPKPGICAAVQNQYLICQLVDTEHFFLTTCWKT